MAANVIDGGEVKRTWSSWRIAGTPAQWYDDAINGLVREYLDDKSERGKEPTP